MLHTSSRSSFSRLAHFRMFSLLIPRMILVYNSLITFSLYSSISCLTTPGRSPPLRSTFGQLSTSLYPLPNCAFRDSSLPMHRSCPRLMMPMRSHRNSTSSIMWLVMKMLVFFLHSRQGEGTLQDVPDLAAVEGVQAGAGLVEDHDAGLAHQRDRDGQSPLHASREFLGLGSPIVVEVHVFQRFPDPLRHFLHGHVLEPGVEVHVLLYGQFGPQDVELRADADEFVGLGHSDAPPRDVGPALSLRVHASEHGDEGGLASSVGPQEAEDLPLDELEGKWFERDLLLLPVAGEVLLAEFADEEGAGVDGGVKDLVLMHPDRLVHEITSTSIQPLSLHLVHLDVRVVLGTPLLQQLLLRGRPAQGQAPLYEGGAVRHPVVLLHHLVEPDGQQVHEEPAVEHSQAVDGLWLQLREGLVALHGLSAGHADEVDHPAEREGRVEEEQVGHVLGGGEDCGAEGDSDERAEDGEEVAHDGGRLRVVDEDLHEVGERHLRHRPPQEDRPDDGGRSGREEGDVQPEDGHQVHQQGGERGQQEADQEEVDPVELDVEPVHLHDLDLPLLLLGDDHVEEEGEEEGQPEGVQPRPDHVDHLVHEGLVLPREGHVHEAARDDLLLVAELQEGTRDLVHQRHQPLSHPQVGADGGRGRRLHHDLRHPVVLVVLGQPEVVDGQVHLHPLRAQLLHLHRAVGDLAAQVVPPLEVELVSDGQHLHYALVDRPHGHEARVEAAHVRAGFLGLQGDHAPGPLLGVGRVLVVVDFLAGEAERLLGEGGEDGQVEGLRVVEGLDCPRGDAVDDLPHSEREQQAEDGRDDLAQVGAVVARLQGQALDEEALEGGEAAVLGGGREEGGAGEVGLAAREGLLLHQ